MAKTLAQKKLELEKIKVGLKESKSVVFADFSGIPTTDINKLKDALFAKKATLSVFKNTLIAKALSALNLPKIDISGTTALIFSLEDAISPIKEVFKFKKDGLNLGIKLGYLEGKILTSEEVENVSKLPPREILLRKVLGGLNAPLVGFVSTLRGTQRKVLLALREVSKVKN
jgi:large subunit ribosomal protein L10